MVGSINTLLHRERRWAALARKADEVTVSFPVRMDDGSHRVFRGCRVVHSTARGPAKGGIRFAPSVALGHVRSLATLMSWKCGLFDLPFGGGKGAVVVDTSELSDRELEGLTRAYTVEIAFFIGPQRDIPALDLYTDARVMGWMMDAYSRLEDRAAPGVITADNAPEIQAEVVAEAANGPTDPEADRILGEKGVLVLPDILASGGGVTVSYLE